MDKKLTNDEKIQFNECTTFEELKLFLKTFDLNKMDDYGNTILHYYLKSISQKSNISQYQRDQPYKLNPKPIIEEMVKNGIDVNAQSKKGAHRHTPLTLSFFMYMEQAKEVFEVLIKNGADINKKISHGKTPLLCITGNYNFNKDRNGYIIKRLIELGADIHLENDYGISAYSSVVEQDDNSEILLVTGFSSTK